MNSNVPKQISDLEQLTRYIFDNNCFKESTRKVRPPAFTPHRIRNDLSVYRTSDCTDEEVWELSRKYVEPKRKKKTLARADTKAKAYFELKLCVISLEKPHIRHVNVVGWPLNRADRNDIRLKLADASSLRIP